MFMEKAAAERLEKNPWTARMTPLIRPHTSAQTASGGDTASESGFHTILYLAWQAGENGYSDLDTVKRAAAAAGAGTSEAARIAAAVHENLGFARSMKVFDDAANPIRMERGEPPLARAEGWEDEQLVAGHLISPLLVPEAAWSLPNLRLMPEVVRNMADARLTKATVETVRKWASEKVISPEAARALSERLEQQLKGR